MKIVDRRSIAPVSGSVPATKIPLSFLDIFWIGTKPVQRIFLYKLPSITTSHFLQNFFPNLEYSLSLTLKDFYPVCGSLVFEPDSRPFIQYEEGYSIPLTLAESDEADFEQLVNRAHGKMIDEACFGELVPCMSKDEVNDKDPLFGVQVTVFPSSGICIGISYKHVLGDGRSIMQFLKTWGSICKNFGILTEDCVMPLVDRTLIPDPGGVLVDTFLKQRANIPADFLESLAKQPSTNEVKMRATFYLKRSELDNMREWILSQVEEGEKLHLSTFVLTCSLMWVCLVKSKNATGNGNEDSKFIFGFVFDCCNRYEYESIVPSNYFGNCLCLGCNALLISKELQEEKGILKAARAIANAIKNIVAKGPTKDADKWLAKASGKIESIGDILGVAGSPRLGVYGLDFGWGKPEKVEVLSIVDPKSISLAESRDGGGGVEVGLVLGKAQMEAFIGIFEEFRVKFCVH